MEHLFKRWKKIEALIRQKEAALLLIDYDGTLVPIAARPELAKVSVKTKKLLTRLRDNPFFTLSIISGRSLKEIRRLVGIRGVIYAGNHGLELKGPKLKFVNKKALLYRRHLRRIHKALQGELAAIKGVFIEDKGLSLSIHFRLANKKDIKKLNGILDRQLKPWVIKKKLKVTFGKMVYELRPYVNWDKGRMVRWLLGQTKTFKSKTLAICIGDDYTDEDMFRAIGTKGITICVGRQNPLSKARFYLRNTTEVKTFLGRLASLTTRSI